MIRVVVVPEEGTEGHAHIKQVTRCFFCTYLAEFRVTFQGERVPCCLLCTLEYPVDNVKKEW